MAWRLGFGPSPEEKDEILRLARRGLKDADIACLIGWCRQGGRNIRLNSGIRKSAYPVSAEERERIVELYRLGFSTKDVADQMGRSHVTIRRIWNETGLPKLRLVSRGHAMGTFGVPVQTQPAKVGGGP